MNGLKSSSITAPFGARENIWNATGARASPTPRTISAMRTFRRTPKADQTGRVLSIGGHGRFRRYGDGAAVCVRPTSGVVRSPGVRGVLDGDLSPAGGRTGMAIDTAPTGSGTRSAHPLDALDPAEIQAAGDVLRADSRVPDAALFAYFGLDEPSKDAVAGFTAGHPVDRRVRVVVVPGPAADVVEAVIDVGRRAVVSWHEVPGVRPALLYGESFNAIVALHEHPEWKAALARRGITDLTRVQIDPWPAGNFGLSHEEGRRISRCLAYYRETDTDNGYARPIEGPT